VIRWATASSTDRRFGDACARPQRWLSPAELAQLSGLAVVKRRRDWLLGRWTAKELLAAHLRLDRLDTLSVEAGADGAPRVRHGGPPLSLSISHCRGRAVCAVAAGVEPIGVDLEWIEPRSDAFVRDFFTPSEAARVWRVRGAERDRRVTATWSAKEAALKAQRTGLRVDTRSVECVVFGDGRGWSPLRIRTPSGEVRGWWKVAAGYVLSAAVGPPREFVEPPRRVVRFSTTGGHHGNRDREFPVSPL
jgi:4'-phosphopantetheinyl transferase